MMKKIKAALVYTSITPELIELVAREVKKHWGGCRTDQLAGSGNSGGGSGSRNGQAFLQILYK